MKPDEHQDDTSLKKGYCSINFNDKDFILCRVYCDACTNDFFVRQIHENKPSCCPYCKVEFSYFEVQEGDGEKQ